MKFLFVGKQPKNVAAFLETLQCLVERGHDVTVAIQERDDERDRRLAEQMASPRFRVVPCPSARMDQWGRVAPVVRRLRDCVHFLQPAFASAPALQSRVFDKLREELGLRADADMLLSAVRTVPRAHLGRLDQVLRLAEHAIPTSELFDEFLRAEDPDVVLISPLIHFGSAQADIAASARRLGLPIWMLLFSWDNLSTKGCMHVEPDLLFVWNERQRTEATELHEFPASRVVVVGAARFDSFFALRPALTRAHFHEPLGLDASRRTVLYLCSSRLIAPRELGFIRRWRAALRASPSAVLRDANVIIRPHPDVSVLSDDMPLTRHAWPAAPFIEAHVARPFDDPRVVVLRTSYKDPSGLYESLAHSDAVVGLNTTAELEAAIVGRPVFTLQPGDPDGPQATVHFRYLTREEGGFVSVAAGLDQHLEQLDAALAAGSDSGPIQTFAGQFLRPHGLDRPVAPLLAEALEQRLGADDAVPSSPPPASIDPPTSAAGAQAGVVPLAYESARILVRATPDTLRQVVDSTVRLDRATVKWLERWVRIGDVVYDIDAGFGAYALIAARQRGAVVVAFEAGYKAYAALCDNLLLNGCQGSVIPVPLAVGSRDALATLKYGRRNPGGEHHAVQWARWRMKPADSVQSNVHAVCAARLDSVVERYGLPPANHVRLAGSGSAEDVLKGAARTLAHPALRSVWLHAAPGDEGTLVRALAKVGLSVAVRRARRAFVQIVFSREPTAVDADAAGSRQPVQTS